MIQLISYHAFTFLAMVGVVTTAFAQEVSPPSKIRILLTVGGHDFEEKPFYDMFDAMPAVECTKVAFPKAADLLKPGLEKQYDVLVRYDMAMKPSPDQQKSFVKLLQAGIGLVALHHNEWVQKDWPEYASITGMTANTSWKEGLDMHVFVVDPTHPITRGLSNFIIHDEAYAGYRLMPGSHVLLRTDHPKNHPSEIAWTRQYTNSPVVYLMLGHGPEAYANPNYRTLLHRAILWVAEERKKVKDSK